MHPALQLDEILLNIFSRCDPPSRVNIQSARGRTAPRRDSFIMADLAALARTCRTFKEPALDVLWSELVDLTPLARCLPQVCYPITGRHGRSSMPMCGGSVVVRPGWYSFHRPLEQDEWNTLRSYTHRIRSIHDFGSAFHADCVRTFLSPPTHDPLFPNLRYLSLTFGNEITALLHQPLPSLITLSYSFTSQGNPSVLQDSLKSFPGDSPNIARLYIHASPEITTDQVVSDFICRWSNPRILVCDRVTLNVDAVTHLSCAPDLTELTFILGAALPDQITPFKDLRFNRLQALRLLCTSLSSVSKLLGRIQLPVITDLSVKFEEHPSKQDFASFLTALQASGVSDSIIKLHSAPCLPRVYHGSSSDVVLVCDDIRPTKAFRNLRHLDLNFKWTVGLTDDDLLDLTSAWPYMENLLINREWGWQRGLGGITLEGIVRLLRTCPSLTELALAIDTRGCLEALLSSSSLHPESNLTSSLSLHVLDSVITPAAVPAMATFLADNVDQIIAPRYGYVGLIAIAREYAGMWRDVFARANEAIKRRCQESRVDSRQHSISHS